jgi:N-acetylmuramoyl-L-alanine amidase
MIEITEMLLRPNGTQGRPTNGNRPGTIITPDTLVIHRTGNPKSTAIQNRNYFDTEISDKTYASAHYVIDDTHIIQCIPENEKSYNVASHNMNTIGIETYEPIRYTDDGNPLIQGTYRNLLELVADICIRHNWKPIPPFVVPHSYFDAVTRPYDPFNWDDYINKEECPEKCLFTGFRFYNDAKFFFVQAGGKL